MLNKNLKYMLLAFLVLPTVSLAENKLYDEKKGGIIEVGNKTTQGIDQAYDDLIKSYKGYMFFRAVADMFGPDARELCEYDRRMNTLQSIIGNIETVIVKKFPNVNKDEAWNRAGQQLLGNSAYQNMVRNEGRGSNGYDGANKCSEALDVGIYKIGEEEQAVLKKYGKDVAVKPKPKDF